MIKKYFVDIISVIIGAILLLSPSSKEGVFVLDVGQGDAILIQKDKNQILVDGGGDDTVLYRVGEYMPLGDMEIEIVVLTHPHSDHINGLMYVLERYEVGQVWFTHIDYESSIYEQFLELDVNKVEIEQGSRYFLGEWYIDVLFASDGIYNRDFNANNASIVLELNTDKRKILLMGDAEVEEEEYLLKKGVLEDVDILKVGHHCSRTASSERFLDTVKPEIAICSYGKDNGFGHPHIETIDNLKERNILMLSTAKEGNIEIL